MPIGDFSRPLFTQDDDLARNAGDLVYQSELQRKELLSHLIQNNKLKSLFSGGPLPPQTPPDPWSTTVNPTPPNTTEMPKTNRVPQFETRVIPGDPTRFAQSELNPLHPLFSPIGKIAHLGNRIGEIGYEHIQKPLERWEQSASLPGPHGTDERTDATLNIVKNLLGVGTGAGVAEGLGATGSRIVQRTDAMSFADKLIKQGKSNSEIASALNERFAPLLDEGAKVTDGMVAGIRYRTGAKAPRDYQVGAFGGRGGVPPPPKLPGTNTTAENLDWLQKQKPVDEEWIKNFAKEADIPIKDIKGSDTKYIRFEDPNKRPGDVIPKVRVPQDEGQHIGTYVRPSERGNLIDVGTGMFKSTGGAIHPSKWNEVSLINQGGQPYSNPEAFADYMKWRFHKAPPSNPLEPPGTGNWLVSPESAPRFPLKNVPEPPKLPPDPNQLRLDLRKPGNEPYNIIDQRTGEIVNKASSNRSASNIINKLDREHGGANFIPVKASEPLPAIGQSQIERSPFTPQMRQDLMAMDHVGEGQPRLPHKVLFNELLKRYPGHGLEHTDPEQFRALINHMREEKLKSSKLSSVGAGPNIEGNAWDIGREDPSLNDFVDRRQQERDYERQIEDYQRSLRGLPPVKQPYKPPPGHQITDDEVMKIIQRYAHAR